MRHAPTLKLATILAASAVLATACREQDALAPRPALELPGASSALVTTTTVWDFAGLAGGDGDHGSPATFTIAGSGSIVASAQQTDAGDHVYSKGDSPPFDTEERGLGVCRQFTVGGPCQGIDYEIGDPFGDGIYPSLFLDFTGLTPGSVVTNVTIASLQTSEGYSIYSSTDGTTYTPMSSGVGTGNPILTLPVPAGVKYLRFDVGAGGEGNNYLVQSVTVVTSTQSNACPDLPAAFGLGPAGVFTVLGLTGANVIISEGGTQITGDVGLGPNDVGSLLKATINGTLFLNGPTNPATPDIHPDLTVTGGIVTADLSAAVAAASAASTALAGLSPEQTFGDITKATTFTGTGGTTHVIKINSVKIIKSTLTFVGGPNDVFIMNVAGDFTFGSAQMILKTTAAGTVLPQNIIWNIYSAGADVNVYKDVSIWYGMFLVPKRNIIIDHTVGTGGVIGGMKIAIHSAATVNCPK
jgi:hypothetical protein